MNMKRIIALIAALAIPALYLISIVLFLVGNGSANVFFAIALGATFFLTPVIYLLTRVPKDIGKMSGDIADMLHGEEKEEK
ncbi:MAG: hypothetical protein Q4F98_04255 [Lachnospiraceae bacterium]|nr:hypothetical protein [Lachnospiraceae bacterium]